MRKGPIWVKVRDIVESGMAPVINLTAAQEVLKPRHARSGRPRVRIYNGDKLDKERAFEHYNASDGRTRRPRCANRGCGNYLKSNDIMVCNDFCRNDVMREAEKTIALLAPGQTAALDRDDGPNEPFGTYRHEFKDKVNSSRRPKS